MWGHAICIEGDYGLFYENRPGLANIDTFARLVDQMAGFGYTGIETVRPLIGDDVPLERYRAVLERAGCEFVGMHWLLAKKAGVHLTDPDRDSMRRTANYIADVARVTHALGGDILVHGSPGQRTLTSHFHGQAEAMRTSIDIYKWVMDAVGDLPVWIAMEQLSMAETDVFTSLKDVLEMTLAVGHPHMKLVLDVKAMWEKCGRSVETMGEVIRAYGKHTVHFHANDVNLGGPGSGIVDFRPIFEALAAIGWGAPHPLLGRPGWVSVEVFDCKDKPLATTAEESIQYMRSVEAAMAFAA